MRRLIEIATERRVTIVMFMVAIALFGIVSLSRLKLNLLPDIEITMEANPVHEDIHEKGDSWKISNILKN